jgi:hypothetical protein
MGCGSRRAALDWTADGGCPYILAVCFEYFAGKVLKERELLSFTSADLS